MTVRDDARAALPPHPTARHGFGRPEGVTETEYYDEMPMTEDGNLFEPTGKPRHKETGTPKLPPTARWPRKPRHRKERSWTG